MKRTTTDLAIRFFINMTCLLFLLLSVIALPQETVYPEGHEFTSERCIHTHDCCADIYPEYKTGDPLLPSIVQSRAWLIEGTVIFFGCIDGRQSEAEWAPVKGSGPYKLRCLDPYHATWNFEEATSSDMVVGWCELPKRLRKQVTFTRNLEVYKDTVMDRSADRRIGVWLSLGLDKE